MELKEFENYFEDNYINTYYSNGKIKIRKPIGDGIEEKFFLNGNIKERILLKNGKANGYGYYMNGNIQIKAFFKDD